MLLLLSPAKALDSTTPPHLTRHTLPAYLDRSQISLIDQLRQMSPADIAKLMDISDQLALLNLVGFVERVKDAVEIVERMAN